MVSCDFENYACDGGFLAPSLEFLTTEGVVSDTCVPYKDKSGKCTHKCQNKDEEYKKYYCKPGTMKILTDPETIQEELMNHGPMMVGLSVFEDFLSYEKGVYEYTAGQMIGGHAIKLLGWGTDENGYLFWRL